MLERSAETFSEKIALQIKRGDSYERISYLELKEYVQKLSQSLAELGLSPGDRVGVMGENRPEWAISYLAILACNATVVPLDPLLKPVEITHIMRDSEVKIAIISGNFLETLHDIKPSLSHLEGIISMDSHKEGLELWKSIAQAGSKEKKTQGPSLEDLAALIYTSGTTGHPKGVMLTHKNIMSNVVGASMAIDVNQDDNFLSVLPIHHTFECTCGFLVPLCVGATITYARSLKSKDIIEGMKDTQVSVMMGVPLLYEKMFLGIMRAINKKPTITRAMFKVSLGAVKSAKNLLRMKIGGAVFKGLRKKAGIDSLRFLMSGGAALPPYIAYGFENLGVNLVQGYGLTETSPVLCVNPILNPRHESVGPPIPGVEIKILDPESDGVGEIAARGESVMAGYYQNPEATEEVMEGEWLRTGDSGWIDKDGFLHISGRLKNLIVTGAGKNVYPEEVEDVLNESPYILETMVYGEPSEDGLREEIKAIVVPDYEYIEQSGATAGAMSDQETQAIIKEEVSKMCSQFADYKRVKEKDVSIRREEFPKTSTKKIQRFLVLQEMEGTAI